MSMSVIFEDRLSKYDSGLYAYKRLKKTSPANGDRFMQCPTSTLVMQYFLCFVDFILKKYSYVHSTTFDTDIWVTAKY